MKFIFGLLAIVGIVGIGLTIGYLASRPNRSSIVEPVASETEQKSADEEVSRTPAPVLASRQWRTSPPDTAARGVERGVDAPPPRESRGDIPTSDQEALEAARRENLDLRNPEQPLFSYAYEKARNGDIDTMKRILDEHPEFITNRVGAYQATLLHNSAYRAQREIVEDLLKRSPDPNAQTSAGHTTLYDGVAGGNKDVVELLLKHGANPNIPDNQGRTPLDLARGKNIPELVQLLERAGAKEGVRFEMLGPGQAAPAPAPR